MKNASTTFYSLSLEELALALGLINRPDLGRNVLSNIYPNITESESETRLSSASHSLLARGICSLNANNSPVLDPDFENALLPLAKFDYLLQVSIVMKEGQANLTVHVRRNHTFTARLIKAGIVNVLTHGPTSGLLDYLLNIFEDFDENDTARSIQGSITLGTIGKIASNQSHRMELLTTAGWKKEDGKLLSEDLDNQKVRATIIRINANEKSQLESLKDATHRNILFLKGQNRSWAFSFENAKDESSGQAYIIDKKILKDLLESMIA